MSSNTTTSGRSAGSLLQRLAEGPGDLLRRRRRLALAEQRADRHRGGLLRGQQVELLQHLDHRPVRDPLAVGQAAAAHDHRLDRCQNLRGEPGLADTGVADDRHQLAALLGLHALPCFPDERELALASDEPRLVPALRRLAHAQEPVGGNRLGLALQLERLDRLDLGRVADECERRPSDQHLARLRRLLQPGRHVHRIARCQPLLRPRHHLARHDADPPLDSELGQRLPHLDRRAQRAQRVVLVHHRHAEHRHHRVADELLHAAAVPLDDPLHPLEVAGEQRPQPLRIERLAERGRAGQVAEENRHRLALLTGGRRGGPLRAALGAESERAVRL